MDQTAIDGDEATEDEVPSLSILPANNHVNLLLQQQHRQHCLQPPQLAFSSPPKSSPVADDANSVVGFRILAPLSMPPAAASSSLTAKAASSAQGYSASPAPFGLSSPHHHHQHPHYNQLLHRQAQQYGSDGSGGGGGDSSGRIRNFSGQVSSSYSPQPPQQSQHSNHGYSWATSSSSQFAAATNSNGTAMMVDSSNSGGGGPCNLLLPSYYGAKPNHLNSDLSVATASSFYYPEQLAAIGASPHHQQHHVQQQQLISSMSFSTSSSISALSSAPECAPIPLSSSSLFGHSVSSTKYEPSKAQASINSTNSSSSNSDRALFSRAALRQCPPPLGTMPSQSSSSLMPSRVYSLLETFCTVPGRMSLLSSTTKYKVTVGEIQRRISPPECLNVSLLGGILRKAKSKDGGKALRESLKRIGLYLPAGRRKSAHITAWTALVEEEALHMARDFHSLCERDFPARELAHYLSRRVRNAEEAHRRRTMFLYARHFIQELVELLNSDRSPICAQRPELVLEPAMQKPLTHFSMVSHGFGTLAVLSVLNSLNAYVQDSLRVLERNAYNDSTNNATSNDSGSDSQQHSQLPHPPPHHQQPPSQQQSQLY